MLGLYAMPRAHLIHATANKLRNTALNITAQSHEALTYTVEHVARFARELSRGARNRAGTFHHSIVWCDQLVRITFLHFRKKKWGARVCVYERERERERGRERESEREGERRGGRGGER